MQDRARVFLAVWAAVIVGCGEGGHDHPLPDASHGGHDAAVRTDAAVTADAAAQVDAATTADAAVSIDAGADASAGTVTEICGTRTLHPDWEVIDPDDPTFSDADWTNEEVRSAFATAREQSSDAYRAYRQARARPDLMYCGFCTCGCNGSLGHESAIDCFKDMHGFG